MRISRKSEYALRALLCMARGPVGRVHQIQELSRSEKIPVKFLEQILLTLRNGGLLTSKRGVGGGYSLQLAPNEITVGGVIELLDGPILPLPSLTDGRDQTGQPAADPALALGTLMIFMNGVREQLEDIFSRKTVADLLEIERVRPALAFDI